jgi:hypothetical protein
LSLYSSVHLYFFKKEWPDMGELEIIIGEVSLTGTPYPVSYLRITVNNKGEKIGRIKNKNKHVRIIGKFSIVISPRCLAPMLKKTV